MTNRVRVLVALLAVTVGASALAAAAMAKGSGGAGSGASVVASVETVPASSTLPASFAGEGCSAWSAPSGVTAIYVTAVGAAGGTGESNGVQGSSQGGTGDGMAAAIPVLSEGEGFYVCADVGGGEGGPGTGGGASGISRGSDFSSPLLVAAGGGGGGTVPFSGGTYEETQPGGAAGYPVGESGPPQEEIYCEGGGTGGDNLTGEGGAGGHAYCGETASGSPGAGTTAAGPGAGGAGGSVAGVHGGGGGAGYYGGGGGAASDIERGEAADGTGGGGGSDYCAAGLGCVRSAGAGTEHLAGTAPGDAEVSIRYASTLSSTVHTQAGAAWDSAQVGSVAGVAPTGEITYERFESEGCEGNPASTETVNLSDGEAPNSVVTQLAPGHYSYATSYSGDVDYGPTTGACENFTVYAQPVCSTASGSGSFEHRDEPGRLELFDELSTDLAARQRLRVSYERGAVHFNLKKLEAASCTGEPGSRVFTGSGAARKGGTLHFSISEDGGGFYVSVELSRGTEIVEATGGPLKTKTQKIA